MGVEVLKLYSIFVSMLCLFFAVLSAGLFVTVKNQNQRIENYETTIREFTKDNEIREYNDTTIYLEDPNNFVASGWVSLGDEVKIISNVPRVYEITGVPGLYANYANSWTRIDAVPGETIHLIGYTDVGSPKRIAYYTCYTNATSCVAETKETDIEVP